MGGGGGGGGGGSRTQRKHFQQSRENVWKHPKPPPSSQDGHDNPTWTPFATQNSAFDEYYKSFRVDPLEQRIVTSEEWETFVEFLRTPLPATFRINSSSQFSADIRSQLENDFLQSLQAEASRQAIRPLLWYPENLAWHTNFSRMQLRKNQTLERFHEFLKLENEIGNITRQEAVRLIKRKLQIQGKWRGVDPVIFFKDDVIINSIKAFYGIDEQFPFNGHLISRNCDPNHVKRIYYVSKSVKDVLELNFSVEQQLKIASIGLKMFERQSSRECNSAPCSFRISSEGLPVILPFITKQILHASPVDFKRLLQKKAVRFTNFVGAEFGEKAANLMLGCFVVVLGNRADLESFQVDESTIAIGCWKGRASLTVMVTAIDCQELLERLLDLETDSPIT